MVWKCLVLPGVDETDTFLDPIRALMVEDLPTLGRSLDDLTVGFSFKQLVGFVGGEESEIDASRFEVVGPGSSLLWRQQIGLVHKKQVSLSGINLGDVVGQIRGSEQQRVSSIDDLNNQVGSFNNSP
ncbi:hypothetical protein WICPIJ_003835 [Wickerhamomyces pijperi]|uniref:Uncharacterized protein n=1 Tax=Wickerhamomyces pijperi TaxID=599730 RepID=A0A9P8TNH2_WICPI|nr:hypothetical protein WICPIJ_003835 [Wickerhamomyces pijperi]